MNAGEASNAGLQVITVTVGVRLLASIFQVFTEQSLTGNQAHSSPREEKPGRSAQGRGGT